MSGIDDSGPPAEVPPEYAAVYRDAYLRALAEESQSSGGVGVGPHPADELVQRATVPAGSGGPLGLRPFLIGLGVVVVIVAVGLVALLSGGGDPSPKPPVAQPTRHAPTSAAPSGSGSPSGDGQSGGTPSGPLVAVLPADARATCTAPPGVDSSNKTVAYDAANTLDDDPSTAWRCDGSAIGETLTFTLPAGTEVAQVGLIPGYAKTDPRSGIDRYAENNRITRVRWTLADGVSVEQQLDPSASNRAVQTISVPPTATGSITLEVLAVKKGPRNTTAISGVEVQAAG